MSSLGYEGYSSERSKKMEGMNLSSRLEKFVESTRPAGRELTPDEIKSLAEKAGLEVLNISPYGRVSRPVLGIWGEKKEGGYHRPFRGIELPLTIKWSSRVERERVVWSPRLQRTQPYDYEWEGLPSPQELIEEHYQLPEEIICPLPERAVILPQAPWWGADTRSYAEWGWAEVVDFMVFESEVEGHVRPYISQLEALLKKS